MKKLLALLLAALMVFGLAACGEENTKTEEPATTAESGSTAGTENAEETFEPDEDTDYVIEKGTLVVGVTDFAPMDYQENGEWVGFDADLARAFAEYLGVEAQIVEIEWDNKIFELDGKTIDCVWNGMTLTDDVKAAMETSNPYCNNAQIVVVKKELAESIKTAADCKSLRFAVEKGSAGQEMAEENGFSFTEVIDQATALQEVANGTCDAAIIDSLMAGAMVGEGTDYAALTTTVKLNSEEYGVGFRKGSGLAERLNAFLAQYAESGKLRELAEEYGVEEALID